MFNDYTYKIELHAHTRPASSCSEFAPEEVMRIYSESGCHAVAITNHFTLSSHTQERALSQSVAIYMDDFYRAKAAGEKLGITALFGMEIRFRGSVNDYLVYGVDESDVAKIYSYLDKSIEEFYAAYKNDGNMILQAHPFRNNNTPANPAFLDGIEVFNMHPNHNGRIGIAAKYAKSNGMTAIAGTDFHHPEQHALGLTLSKTLPANSFELAALIASRDYIFSIGGYPVAANAPTLSHS